MGYFNLDLMSKIIVFIIIYNFFSLMAIFFLANFHYLTNLFFFYFS